jgi:DNA invertase Pin-like site-specific DNA recombinase
VRVALYVRVSSDQQAQKDLSIPAQLKLLRRYAKRGKHVIIREWVEPGETATTADRPAFQELIALAKTKPAPFDALLIWKFSRFARNREDAVTYKALLRRRGIQVISISEPIDDSPTGKLLEGIIETVDEFYSLNLGQDVRRAKAQIAERGGWGSSKAPDGYKIVRKDGIRKLVIDPERAPIIRRIFRMARRGISTAHIARELTAEGLRNQDGRPWQQAAISRILRNEAYIGVIVNRRANVRTERAHPPLVSRKTWDATRASITARRPSMVHPRRVNSPYLLSGLLHCAKCGAHMIGERCHNNQGREYRYYTCRTRKSYGREKCPQANIRKDRLEAAVLGQLKKVLFSKERIKASLNRAQKQIEAGLAEKKQKLMDADSRLAGLTCRRDNLLAAIESGHVDLRSTGDRLKALAREIETLRTERDAIAAAVQSDGRLPRVIDVVRSVAKLEQLLKRGTPAECRQWLQDVITHIETDGTAVAASYRLPGLKTRRSAIKAPASVDDAIAEPLKLVFLLKETG